MENDYVELKPHSIYKSLHYLVENSNISKTLTAIHFDPLTISLLCVFT